MSGRKIEQVHSSYDFCMIPNMPSETITLLSQDLGFSIINEVLAAHVNKADNERSQDGRVNNVFHFF